MPTSPRAFHQNNSLSITLAFSCFSPLSRSKCILFSVPWPQRLRDIIFLRPPTRAKYSVLEHRLQPYLFKRSFTSFPRLLCGIVFSCSHTQKSDLLNLVDKDMHIWFFKTTNFQILRNATSLSATNQHSSKWYPRLNKDLHDGVGISFVTPVGGLNSVSYNLGPQYELIHHRPPSCMTDKSGRV